MDLCVSEVVVNELLETSSLSEEEVTVLNQSTFARGFRRDIIGVELNLRDKIQFNLSRNGLHDALPQGLFMPVLGSTKRYHTMN